jgi:ketosteroid isomerase-like protein
MSGPSENLARRYYELVDNGDVEGLVALFDPDAVYNRPGYEPLRGRDHLRRFYLEQRVIREGKHSLDLVVVSGSDVAVRGSFHGVLHTGNAVDAQFADFFRINSDDTFSRRDTFFFAPLI